MDYPAYYTDFWSRFRAANADLPTGGGWQREPAELHRCYDGARSARWRTVFCHVGFVGLGHHRRLTVEWFGSNRKMADWADFLAHVEGVRLPFHLVREGLPRRRCEHRRAYLTGLVHADDLRAERDALLALAAGAYREMVRHIEPAYRAQVGTRPCDHRGYSGTRARACAISPRLRVEGAQVTTFPTP